MSDDGTPPLFTEVELRSYLPTGWQLPRGVGTWDKKRRCWALTVRDGALVDWPLSVTARAASVQGRLEALRSAFDVLVRKRLG